MLETQSELWNRINAFQVDGDDVKLSFVSRLARENGWTREYAHQVFEEYKKFAFLAMAAGHPCTPSDQVDQAWHLHLTYTRSYWEHFCNGVLPRPLHHDPTKGGKSENEKYDDWYAKTLESYERIFGYRPPTSIWPESQVRFGEDLHYVRVNTKRNWVLSKENARRSAAWLSLLVPIAMIATGCVAQLETPAVGAVLIIGGGLFVIFICVLIASQVSRQTGRGSRDGSSGCGTIGSGCGSTSSHTDSGGCGADAGGGGGCGGGGCGGGGCGGGGCGGGGD